MDSYTDTIVLQMAISLTVDTRASDGDMYSIRYVAL